MSDVISKKWIGDITSVDETSVEVHAVFAYALRQEGLDELIEQRNPGGVGWEPDSDEAPVLLVMLDNGPQMTSGSTREFMALCWLATHYGRPGIRPGSSRCSVISKPSNHASNSSKTSTFYALNSTCNAPTTTPSGYTPVLAM